MLRQPIWYDYETNWMLHASILRIHHERVEALSVERQNTINALLGLAFEASKLACDMDDLNPMIGRYDIREGLANLTSSYHAFETAFPIFRASEPEFNSRFHDDHPGFLAPRPSLFDDEVVDAKIKDEVGDKTLVDVEGEVVVAAPVAEEGAMYVKVEDYEDTKPVIGDSTTVTARDALGVPLACVVKTEATDEEDVKPFARNATGEMGWDLFYDPLASLAKTEEKEDLALKAEEMVNTRPRTPTGRVASVLSATSRTRKRRVLPAGWTS